MGCNMNYRNNNNCNMMRDMRPDHCMDHEDMRSDHCMDHEDMHHHHHHHQNIDDMPIGMCYVPWQDWQNIYDLENAFQCGTIFAELNKPFLGRCMR